MDSGRGLKGSPSTRPRADVVCSESRLLGMIRIDDLSDVRISEAKSRGVTTGTFLETCSLAPLRAGTSKRAVGGPIIVPELPFRTSE